MNCFDHVHTSSQGCRIWRYKGPDPWSQFGLTLKSQLTSVPTDCRASYKHVERQLLPLPVSLPYRWIFPTTCPKMFLLQSMFLSNSIQNTIHIHMLWESLRIGTNTQVSYIIISLTQIILNCYTSVAKALFTFNLA